MAAETLKKVSVNLKLENGTDAEGNIKLVSQPLGTLGKDSFDADKALAIVRLLAPCLSKTINSTEKVTISTISAA